MESVDWNAVFILFIIFGLPLLIISCTIIFSIYLTRSKSYKNLEQKHAEDVQFLQEAHTILNQLEARINTLETLLLEEQKKEKYSK